MTIRKRADLLLVERGLFESRAKAQAAIAAGRVTADGVVCAGHPTQSAKAPSSRLRRSIRGSRAAA